MTKSIFMLVFTCFWGSAAVNAQNNEVIKKAIENPKAKDDAAKADARLIDNKQLTDSVSAPKNKATKKKNCWFRKKAKTPKN